MMGSNKKQFSGMFNTCTCIYTYVLEHPHRKYAVFTNHLLYVPGTSQISHFLTCPLASLALPQGSFDLLEQLMGDAPI